MRRFSMLLVVTIGIGGLMLACGGDSGSENSPSLAGYFPESVDSSGLEKVSEVRTFVGDSLWEYINGGAELYHTYGFVQVLTADYKSAEAELVLDLYQFETDDGAYGLYTALRPDEPEIVPLGVEGFVTGSSLEFAKGNIMVRLVGYNASDATNRAIRSLADRMEAALPGTTDRPAAFGLLPPGATIAHTDKLVGEAFLGHSFLNMVYQRNYEIGPDTLTLFVTDDESGSKFAQWSELPGPHLEIPGGMPFDENYYVGVPNSYYGNILAGLKNEKLVGVINFSDQHMDFVSAWLESIPVPPGQSGN